MIDFNEDNHEMLLIKAYENSPCLISEFEKDYKRVQYIKRLVGKYQKNKKISERLILNHIIVLGNVFGPILTAKLLFLRIDEKFYSVIKTFLVYLNYISDKPLFVNGRIIETKLIPIDMKVAQKLREL